jgi:hypothetical protein
MSAAQLKLFSHATIWSSVNIFLCHICAPGAIVFSALLVAMLQSPSDTWNQSSCVKYVVMLMVGSLGLLCPVVLYLLMLLRCLHLDCHF